MTRKEWKQEVNHLLHVLWTKDVGTPGYDKALWRRFANLLEEGFTPEEDAAQCIQASGPTIWERL